MTRASLREYAAVQRARYQQASRAEKQRFLNEVVAVTHIHRKAAIRLLRRPPHTPTVRPRSGRPRLYGPAVAAAAAVLWEATGRIGAVRLQPFVPELVDRLTRCGELPLAPAARSGASKDVLDYLPLPWSTSTILPHCMQTYWPVGVPR